MPENSLSISADVGCHFFPSGHGGPGTHEPQPYKQPSLHQSAQVIDPFESHPADQPTPVTVQSPSVGEEDLLQLAVTANRKVFRAILGKLPEHLQSEAVAARCLRIAVQSERSASKKAMQRLPQDLRPLAQQRRLARHQAFVASRSERQSAKDKVRGYGQKETQQLLRRTSGK